MKRLDLIMEAGLYLGPIGLELARARERRNSQEGPSRARLRNLAARAVGVLADLEGQRPGA
jgi:hypothetical protein